MNDAYPKLVPQGDLGLLVYLGEGISPDLNARVHALAAALREDPDPALQEVVPAYHCLQIILNSGPVDRIGLENRVLDKYRGLGEVKAAGGKLVELPTVYGGEYGPDLDFVARHTGLSQDEVIKRHSGRDYLCYLVGFSPGFPFLGGLDPALETPRLDTPRLDLPVGSVGIAARQAGIYPLGGPGGWQVLGRSPALVYDPRRENPALVKAGDMVRFTPVAAAEFPDPPPVDGPPWTDGEPVLEVIQPGAFTTVQDRGRKGYWDIGVPGCGVLDSFSLQAGNALVGNDPNAAALELTLLGPKLKALAPVSVALCGSDLGMRVDKQSVPIWQAVHLKPGQVIDFNGPKKGLRAVLAIGGGLSAPLVLGSRGAYPLGRMGGPLKKGQVLRVCAPVKAPIAALVPENLRPAESRSITVRVVPGPNQEHFSAKGVETFYDSAYRLSPDTDRRALRLEGAKVELNPELPSSILSEPNFPGIIQVPSGGQPIILLNEQTMGGYAKIATAISADLDALARAMPGDVIRFEAVNLEQAAQAAAKRAKALEEIGALS